MPREKILVIEDEPDIAEVLQYNLEKEGFDLRELPLFLIVGRTESGLEPLFQASKLQLKVKHAPRPDAPLHVYASPEAVFARGLRLPPWCTTM